MTPGRSSFVLTNVPSSRDRRRAESPATGPRTSRSADGQRRSHRSRDRYTRRAGVRSDDKGEVSVPERSWRAHPDGRSASPPREPDAVAPVQADAEATREFVACHATGVPHKGCSETPAQRLRDILCYVHIVTNTLDGQPEIGRASCRE